MKIKRRLFVLGDSISVHYGIYLRDMIEPEMNYDRKGGVEATDIIDPSVNGGDSREVLQYMKSKMSEASEKPKIDILLLNCGLHDIRRRKGTREINVPIDEYANNVREIIKTGNSLSENLIWIHTTPVIDKLHNALQKEFDRFNSDVIHYNAMAADIMDKMNVPHIPLYEFTLRYGESAYCDHVHFTNMQRQLQAAFIAGWLWSVVELPL